VKSERDIKSQITAIRERVKELSGFWLGEGAAMIYVLEWALDKRPTAPAGELGRAGGDSEKIAANLAKLAEKAAARPPAPAPKETRPVAGPKKVPAKKAKAAKK